MWRTTGNDKCDGNGWLIGALHSHLSDDKTVAKMGHPFVRGALRRTGNGKSKRATATAKADPPPAAKDDNKKNDGNNGKEYV
jgi:hypothetical protein